MKTILHVDASDFYRKVLHNKFTEAGYNYIEAKNFEEANNVITNEPVDIIFTAVEFPFDDTARFIQTLNETKFKHIPIFVITSNENQKKKEELFSLGIVDYISKNTPLEDITRYIQYFNEKDMIIERMRGLSYAVVDDSSLVLKVVQRIFNIHEIANADFFRHGTDLLNNNKHYDVYLIDFVLEESTGERMVREIRKRNQNAIIIIISAIQNSKTISNVLSTGADDYITKPFNMDIFMARIKTNVRTYLLFKELEEKNRLLEEISKKES